jgi:ABC-type branched-subunit amino acid transport system substrate-binding protein
LRRWLDKGDAVIQRKWFRLFAVLFGVLLIAGACGGRDDDDGTSAGEDEEEEAKELTNGPGFDGTTIKLGVLTPLSGPVAAPIGLPLTAGGDVYWQRVNEAGGIAGKYKVEIVKEDNQYDTGQTKQKYTKIKEEVVMFSQILGTPPTQTVLQDLKSDNVVAAPASLDGEWVREPNLLPVGSTYQLQFINAADYAINDGGLKGKPICIIAEEGAYGDAGIEGLEYAAEELDFDIAVTARFKATDQDLTAPVQQLKNGNCAGVFVTATPSPTGKIVGTSAQLAFAPKWFGQSPTWVNALVGSPIYPVLEKDYILAAEGPQWGDESVPGMKQLLDDVAKYAPTQGPDGYFVFGYAQAMAVHQVLETAVENGDLSREGILKAVEETEVDSKGLYGEYQYGAADDRDPSRTTAVFKINKNVPGNLEKIEDITSDAAKSFSFD